MFLITPPQEHNPGDWLKRTSTKDPRRTVAAGHVMCRAILSGNTTRMRALPQEQMLIGLEPCSCRHTSWPWLGQVEWDIGIWSFVERDWLPHVVIGNLIESCPTGCYDTSCQLPRTRRECKKNKIKAKTGFQTPAAFGCQLKKPLTNYRLTTGFIP